MGMDSKVCTSYTELACIDAALKEYGSDDVITKNEKQEELLRWWTRRSRDIGILGDCLSGSFGTVDQVNALLISGGFALRVPVPAEGTGDYKAAAGILDYKMKWRKAEPSTVRSDASIWKAVKIPCKILQVVTHEQEIMTVAEITIPNGDQIYLTKDTNVIPYTSSIFDAASVYEQLGYVVVPECLVNCDGDVGWLVGMTFGGAQIDWAGQESKIEINLEGIEAKSVTAIRTFSGCIDADFTNIERIYTIDTPYNIWITRIGLSKPIISAYVSREAWRLDT